MLRISLIIAIIAGVAALAISQLKVAEKIKSITEERNKFEQDWKTSQEAERKARKDAKDATAAADKLRKDLDTTKADLTAASEKADAARQLVERILTQLSPPARLVITLLEIEERSVKEISKLTGWSVPLVKVRAFRARAEMRKIVARMTKDKYL